MDFGSFVMLVLILSGFTVLNGAVTWIAANYIVHLSMSLCQALVVGGLTGVVAIIVAVGVSDNQ